MKRKVRISENLAIKCNWNDAGYAGVCSEEAYDYNTRIRKANWCSSEDCRCQLWSSEEVDEGNFPCYESKMLIDFSCAVTGQPYRICNSEAGKIALLTTRQPGDREEDRYIFAYFYIKEISEDSDSPISWIYGDPERSLIIDESVARNMKFWDYYQNPNSGLVRWNTGLFRYVPDQAIYRFFSDLNQAYKTSGIKDSLKLIEKHLDLYAPSIRR